MPDIQDGFDVSLRNATLGELSCAAGSLNRPALSLPAAASPCTPAVEVDDAGVAWERLARTVWQGRECPPDRRSSGSSVADLPHWIAAFATPPLEDFDEEPLPLRYGIDLTPRPNSTPFPGSLPAHVAVRSAKTMLCPAVLRFPRAGRSDFSDDHRPPVQIHGPGRDSVLPFRPPVRETITIFSLVGGTGRTSIAANLARLLAGSGLRVLLADTCGHSILPHMFGAGDVRQGVVRHFIPANNDRNRMISLVSLAVDAFAGDDCEQYRILEEITRDAAHVDRIIWDLSNSPLDWSAKVLCASPQILVPLLPDTNSLVQLRATERFLNRCHEEDPAPHLRYVLNHFDEMDPLHIDVRSRLRELLGPQMLPVTLRSSPLVDEALSMGRTVVDHAPASPLVGDLWRLAQHLNQIDVRRGFDALACSRSEWLEQ